MAMLKPKGTFKHSAHMAGGGGEFDNTALHFLETGLTRKEACFAVVSSERLLALRSALSGEIGWESAEQFWNGAPFTEVMLEDLIRSLLQRASRARVLLEPVWMYEPEGIDWRRWDAAHNINYADVPLHLLCLFDGSAPSEVVEAALSTHPELLNATEAKHNLAFEDPDEYLARLDRKVDLRDTMVLSETPLDRYVPRLRREVCSTAVNVGVSNEKADDVALAVHEVIANAFEHGDVPITLRLKTSPRAFVVEVEDAGPGVPRIEGYAPPDRIAEGQRGLFMARSLSDLVVVEPKRHGNLIRLIWWKNQLAA